MMTVPGENQAGGRKAFDEIIRGSFVRQVDDEAGIGVGRTLATMPASELATRSVGSSRESRCAADRPAKPPLFRNANQPDKLRYGAAAYRMVAKVQRNVETKQARVLFTDRPAQEFPERRPKREQNHGDSNAVGVFLRRTDVGELDSGRPCGRPWKCRARPPTKSDRISDIRAQRRRLRLGSRHGGGFGDPLTLIAPMPVDRNLSPSCTFSGGLRSGRRRVADGGRRRPGCGLLPWRDRVPRRLRAGDWPGKRRCRPPI